MIFNSHRCIRSAIWILVFSFISVLAFGQASQQLYVVTGLAATNAFPHSVPSALFAIDEATSAAVKVSDLGGSSLILADHDRRFIVVGDFGHHLVEVDMNSPTKRLTIETSFGPQFLCTPSGSTVEEGCIDAIALEHRLLGIDLTGSGAGARHELPFNYLQSIRREGFWSPIDLVQYPTFLYFRNGKLLFHPNEQTAELGIPIPLNSEAFATAANILLAVSNDDMVVIDCYRRPTSAGGAETHIFQIYDKKFKSWQNVNLNAGPSIRGFGPWIATASFIRKRPIGVAPNEADLRAEPESPGATFRKRILNPKAREQDQASLDSMFQEVPSQFTGDLHLYNIRSGQNFVIRTGQGDSEILLVDGNTVYYRVNDTLYRASLGNSGVENPVKILTGDSVQLAHWAFLGPHLPQ